MKNKVVIIGGDHHNTLGVVESFGEKGIKSYVLLLTSHKRGYVLHSKYVESGWCCNSDISIIECLESNFKDKKNKAVIIATNDVVAWILDNNYDSLKDYFHIPTIDPAGNLSELMSKQYMNSLAKQVGFSVPKTWVIYDNKIPTEIEYPVITKAISSLAGTKDNIKIIYEESQLSCFLESQQVCPVIQVQKYIDKEFEFQLLGCSLNKGDTVLIPGRTHIVRPNGLDNTFFLRYDKCEPSLTQTLNKAVNFVQKTKFTGLFSIEFLHDKNGNDYFLEMNFRNDGNSYCVTASGTNLPYILYLSAIGGDYQNEISNSKVETIHMMPEIYYFTRLLAGEFSIHEWWSNFRKTNCFTTYFKNDKKPFFWFIILALKKRIFSY